METACLGSPKSQTENFIKFCNRNLQKCIENKKLIFLSEVKAYEVPNVSGNVSKEKDHRYEFLPKLEDFADSVSQEDKLTKVKDIVTQKMKMMLLQLVPDIDTKFDASISKIRVLK